LQGLCDNAGIVLEFLPPYSPDFNPIEESFAEMKAWMRKNYTLQENYEMFEGFLELAVCNIWLQKLGITFDRATSSFRRETTTRSLNYGHGDQ
jgi:transposase